MDATKVRTAVRLLKLPDFQLPCCVIASRENHNSNGTKLLGNGGRWEVVHTRFPILPRHIRRERGGNNEDLPLYIQAFVRIDALGLPLPSMADVNHHALGITAVKCSSTGLRCNKVLGVLQDAAIYGCHRLLFVQACPCQEDVLKVGSFVATWLYAKLLHIEGEELRSSIEAGAWRITPLKCITCDEHQVVARSRWSDDGISCLAVGRYAYSG